MAKKTAKAKAEKKPPTPPAAPPVSQPTTPQPNHVRLTLPLGFLGLWRATDMEASRYALGGVLIEQDATTNYAIATDGRWMAILQWPKEDEDKVIGEFLIVPAEAIRRTEKCL